MTAGDHRKLGAADEGVDGTLRRCIVTRESRDRRAMVRFVVAPDGSIVPDLEERLPGRGFWLSADRDVVNTACAKNVFAKAARMKVTVPPDLADRVEERLVARCLNFIGLARRAGRAFAGFEKVKARLREGPVGLLIEASDGTPGGRSKVEGLAQGARRVGLFTGAELGRALGRDRTVHLVLESGALTNRLMAEAERLAGFRGSSGPEDHGDLNESDRRKNGMT